MKQLKNMRLIKIVLVLLIILLTIFIIKECKILGFCYTIITLISPLFFGFTLAWLIKPIMFYFNKYLNVELATSLTYLLLLIITSVIGYFALPVIIEEIKELIAYLIKLYESLDPNLLMNIDISTIGTKVLNYLNSLLTNTKNIFLNILYSLFISFFFLINHEAVSEFLARCLPTDLIKEISFNLKAFVKGTLIDTSVLFILVIILFYLIKLPYALLFAIIISITNIIPYLGPYLGGLPAVLVGFGISTNLGLIVLGIVLVIQFVESTFIYPYIMSKSLEINQILIMMSLIVCGYFFGIIGMIISTPVISVIKTLYEYNKAQKILNLQILDKYFY